MNILNKKGIAFSFVIILIFLTLIIISLSLYIYSNKNQRLSNISSNSILIETFAESSKNEIFNELYLNVNNKKSIFYNYFRKNIYSKIKPLNILPKNTISLYKKLGYNIKIEKSYINITDIKEIKYQISKYKTRILDNLNIEKLGNISYTIIVSYKNHKFKIKTIKQFNTVRIVMQYPINNFVLFIKNIDNINKLKNLKIIDNSKNSKIFLNNSIENINDLNLNNNNLKIFDINSYKKKFNNLFLNNIKDNHFLDELKYGFLITPFYYNINYNLDYIYKKNNFLKLDKKIINYPIIYNDLTKLYKNNILNINGIYYINNSKKNIYFKTNTIINGKGIIIFAANSDNNQSKFPKRDIFINGITKKNSDSKLTIINCYGDFHLSSKQIQASIIAYNGTIISNYINIYGQLYLEDIFKTSINGLIEYDSSLLDSKDNYIVNISKLTVFEKYGN